MKQIVTTAIIILVFSFIACNETKEQNLSSKKEIKKNFTEKQKVVDLLKSIETGATEPVSYINPDKYIQHNLTIEDGLEGFGAVLDMLPPNTAKVNTVRVFQDGDFVFTHTDYNFFGPKIGFDIFRFEDGEIVEHWDNLQETPKKLNPSGYSMIDGPTKVSNTNKTEVNKILVKDFVKEILINGKFKKLSKYFNGNEYIQHNPQISDGLSGLMQALENLASQGIMIKYEKIHRVLGEGNFVLVVSEGKFGKKSTSFYDLFRVENGKIKEHWDVIETIPPRTEWKNENGKF